MNISSYPGTKIPGLFFFSSRAVIFKSGVSCRNIGQEQLRVTQSCNERQTIKNSLFGFNLNGPLNHGKKGKTMNYVI